MSNQPSRDHAEYADENYVNTVKAIAEAIRDIAADFEHDALNARHESGLADRGPRVLAVVRAIHTLNWGIANASIERAIRDAAEADHAERLLTS